MNERSISSLLPLLPVIDSIMNEMRLVIPNMCLKWRSNERKWPFRGLSLTSLNVISQPIESGRATLSSSAFITSHAKSNRSQKPEARCLEPSANLQP